jgi:hypothetical protein
VPDVPTALSAYQDVLRMQLYEAMTFGNRSNTAGFVVLVGPFLLWLALDKSRSRLVRTACALTLVPLLLNALVLQVRAAFLTLAFALAIVWAFRLGMRKYPLFLGAVVVALGLLDSYSPDIAWTMMDRLRPVVTADTASDASVMERVASIKEGVVTAQRHWVLGVGPGGALTRHSQTSAHQFQVQQFMESGVLGLIGSTLVSVSVLLMLARTLSRGADGGANNVRFALLIGPACFVVYGTLANVTFNVGYVNTWAVILSSMLALAPGFTKGDGRSARRAPAPSGAAAPAARA